MLLDIDVNNYAKKLFKLFQYEHGFSQCSILVTIHHDHDNSYKRKHLTKTNHTSE